MTLGDGPPDEVRQRLLASAAAELGLPVGQLRLVRLEARTWPDASLGCPQPGWQYAQVLTPGYEIVVQAAGQAQTLHADTRGRCVRCVAP